MSSKNAEAQGRMLNSPFKWVGGKSRLRKFIVPIIPPHTCYVERSQAPHGCFSVSPGARSEVLNDIDGELTTFFRVVKKNQKI